MALDIYVGPLVRYFTGRWETIAAHVLAAEGVEVRTVRTGGSDPAANDPGQVAEVLAGWRAYLADGLGCAADWPDNIDGEYWTDRPAWDGFGAVVIVAARLAMPDHPDVTADPGDPAGYADLPLVQAARHGTRLRSLVGGAEWWLPITPAAQTFSVGMPNGNMTEMSTVDRLVNDLAEVVDQSGFIARSEIDPVRRAGIPARNAAFDDCARWGLAVMTWAALTARRYRQPMLLDY